MKRKKIWILTLCAGITATTIADPLGWFERAPFEWSGTDLDEKISFDIAGWPDGSAEALIRPLYELPESERPGYGVIRINDKSFKFAPRKDRDDKWTFYASVPVDTIPLTGEFEFEMEIQDNTGKTMLKRSFEYSYED